MIVVMMTRFETVDTALLYLLLQLFCYICIGTVLDPRHRACHASSRTRTNVVPMTILLITSVGALR